MCPDCGAAQAACVCHRNASATAATVPGDGIVRVGRETKGRKGAGVTIITGVPLDDAALNALCTRLKKRCGSGGAVKQGVIELQGDHRDTAADELTKQGWIVKRTGG